MFNSISTSRSFSNLSRSSYDNIEENSFTDGSTQRDGYGYEDYDGDMTANEDEEEAEQDETNNEDLEDMIDDCGDDDDGDDDDDVDDEDLNDAGDDGSGNRTLSKNSLSHAAPSKIIEPPEFVLNLSDLLEAAHDILEPLEEIEEQAHSESAPIGRHILSDTQRRLHLQRLSLRVVNSLSNCSAGLNNDRLDEALQLSSLVFPLYFPPPLDPSTLDLKSDVPLLREISPPRPAPLILLHWLNEHDRHPDSKSFLDVLDHEPNCALHYNFWPLLQKLALRCRLDDLKALIAKPRWEITDASQPGSRPYSRTASSNLQKACRVLQDIVSQCPSLRFFPNSRNEVPSNRTSRRGGNTDEENWDTSSLPWRMWRSKIARALDEIARISHPGPNAIKKSLSLDVQNDSTRLFRSRQNNSQAGDVSNLIPHEILQELRIVLQIFLGDKETILKTSDTWLEAVAGLTAYYDETGSSGDGMEWDKQATPGTAHRATNAYHEDPMKKIAKCFQLATSQSFPLPAVRNLQSAIGDILAGRIPRALKFLAKKSLPVASAAAEIFAWGGYFPAELGGKMRSSAYLTGNTLGVLDYDAERENVKEKIISEYALALGSLGVLHRTSKETVEGWEIGLATLRRTTTIGTQKAASKLIRSIDLDINNPGRVERLVSICARHDLTDEQKYVSESFAQKLLAAGHLGSSLLYFSRAGCSSSIHNVMAGYVTTSLRLGKSIPAEEDLDDIMRELLGSPMATAEEDILRREIAGFAALRSFYTSRNAGRYDEAVQTLVILMLSAGEKLDGGVLRTEWESVLVPENIAGLVYELLKGSEDANLSEKFSERLVSADIFGILGVLEALFLIGGETLESVQEEFAQVLAERHINLDFDFTEAISMLRSVLAKGIGSSWLKDEQVRRLVF
ncbi:hypothetical protein H072_5771 [Dactylellina haptotyla CBS 200.50]|uniref:Nuclear pore complex protein Nup85 n=1 Tax=Dactylellina haptotyla (strain CBS 200.50) TaxID=1284197 RepID=S8AGZ5_DACHA|nr:hypothetical protein H072_5771 [Dactylellina haptotyla CBS 200.50]